MLCMLYSIEENTYFTNGRLEEYLTFLHAMVSCILCTPELRKYIHTFTYLDL